MTLDTSAVADLMRIFAGRAPAWMVLRDCEIERGYWPVPVGSVPWLRAKDWHEHDCISMNGDEVRIVAIYARKRHRGAFKRLIKSIRAAGLKPVVIAPLEEMTAILTKWGWQHVEVGHDYRTREHQWRPPAGPTP